MLGGPARGDEVYYSRYRSLRRRSHPPDPAFAYRRTNPRRANRRTCRPHRAHDRSAASRADIALPGNRKVTLNSIRRPAPAACRFPPRRRCAPETNAGAIRSPSPSCSVLADGPITARAVLDAAKEANLRNYRHLLYRLRYHRRCAPRNRKRRGRAGAARHLRHGDDGPANGDLLKNQRSSQIFCRLRPAGDRVPDVPDPAEDGTPRWQIAPARPRRVRSGDDVPPITARGTDVPAWMLDTEFGTAWPLRRPSILPRTSAWRSAQGAEGHA